MEEEILRVKLAALKSENRNLDGVIDALLEASAKDQLRLARLKSKKVGPDVRTDPKLADSKWPRRPRRRPV